MRLAGQGRVDRNRPIGFRFEGRPVQGFAGDTIASALLAQGERLMGRSFKYHRPRGVLTAGSEEPNALVTVHRGADREPNVRASMQEIYEGLDARAQNAWPSLGFDLLSVNDLAAPFLGAGFYYKTFMWPRAFWERIYEPAIRRAAGLGALSGRANDARYEKAYAFCDLLVIGAGPAGLMAALEAGRAGADVILADEGAEMGGRLGAESYEIGGQGGFDWARTVLAELASMDNVRLMPRTTVTGTYDQGTYGALERVSQHLAPREDLPRAAFWRIVAERAILATGAIERPIGFQNNDRPGVMMASAVRAYLHRYGVVPGRNVVVFGNNDEAHRTAHDLTAAGVHVAALVDSRPGIKVQGPFPVFAGAEVCGASGRKGLEAVSIRTAHGIERISTECLAMSGGWNPSLHLTCHMNGRPEWREDIAAFVPQGGMIPGLTAVGAAAGSFSTHSALTEGRAAAQSALEALGRAPAGSDLPEAEDAPIQISPLWAVGGTGRAWLDFQNDVTVKDVTQAAKENFTSVEHMKRYTTQGMAPDQGKNSNVAALAILADVTGRSIPDTGTTTFRPPYTPVPIAAMGAGAEGHGFAPERHTSSHEASLARGAPMIEAGLWYRPSYFPKEGEKTWRQSCDREVRMVRESVGICDVSTLGKIDIKGPDAGALLDFVYTNTFSTLKPGRVRYGLMLREDGHVMDDGTSARLSEQHYVMTTTTAAAGQVMRHLEFAHQVLRPELDVSMISVTEQWAQFAVAGPQSRALLNRLLDRPIDDDSFPYMGCGEVSVLGQPGRLFRISFSGEHAYEIAVPARFGAALYTRLVAEAETMEGGAYGMEALNVLRIEKGFITHAEIHGRVTAFDIGMERMISPKKDCIGKTMAARPGLIGPEREQLIGLKPTGAVQQLLPGGFLFKPDNPPERVFAEGYVTSACFSPTLGHVLALGFLKNGRARLGEQVKFTDHLRGLETTCEVIAPVTFDPEGGRCRG